MMTLMDLLRAAFRLTLLCLLMVAASAAVRAQKRILWQGVVRPEQINVYTSASLGDPVAYTLKRGDVIDVVLEINAMGAGWCRISFSGQSETLGYVLCLNLERGDVGPNQVGRNGPVVTQSPAIPATPKLTEATVANSAALTDKDILDMNKIGLRSEILVAKIKSSQCNFDTSAGSLQALKAAGLGDSVILAMVEAPSGQPRAAVVPDPPDAANTSNRPNPTTIPSDGKIRVLVTDSQSWETRGGGTVGGNNHGWGGSSWMAGGARPQTVEIIKTLNQRCPEIIVTNNLEKADFVITLDHEGGKSLLAHRNKIAVFNKDGDDIFSNSTVALGNSVKDACQAILSNAKK
jgi:hypothetical protein